MSRIISDFLEILLGQLRSYLEELKYLATVKICNFEDGKYLARLREKLVRLSSLLDEKNDEWWLLIESLRGDARLAEEKLYEDFCFAGFHLGEWMCVVWEVTIDIEFILAEPSNGRGQRFGSPFGLDLSKYLSNSTVSGNSGKTVPDSNLSKILRKPAFENRGIMGPAVSIEEVIQVVSAKTVEQIWTNQQNKFKRNEQLFKVDNENIFGCTYLLDSKIDSFDWNHECKHLNLDEILVRKKDDFGGFVMEGIERGMGVMIEKSVHETPLIFGKNEECSGDLNDQRSWNVKDWMLPPWPPPEGADAE